MCVGCVMMVGGAVASIDKQLKVIEAKKANVEELWLNATRQLENEKMVCVVLAGG